MLIGVYGDVHLTKNMRTLQYLWDVTASKSIHNMYNKFDEKSVEMVVCLGDFFDSPRLEAKHMSLVLPILQDINSRSYPTYILLGNHEAESEDSNILEMLGVYENIHPITIPQILENMLFLPYYADPSQFDVKDRIVFTHHDIYGSALAGGKTHAFFGLDPSVFAGAKRVFNGHVHLKSRVNDLIINTGSFLISQQGELVLGEYPDIYFVDTKNGSYYVEPNKESMIYLTIDENEAGKVVQSGYDQMHCVLRVEYEGEMPESFIGTAHTTWRKKISSIDSEGTKEVHMDSFDMINYLIDHINKSSDVSDSEKEDYIKTGLEILS